jgi:phosphoglycolate phosphatase-like HAD superfamily hydrolase
MTRTAVIFDMDGTLANVSSIRHHLTAFDATKRRVVKHFDRFHDESVNVPPHSHVVNAAQVAKMLGHDVLIVTARKHMWRHHTAWWLAMHGVPSDALFMRGNLDNRKDYEVKRDMLATIRKAWTPIYAWDDNPAIIALWQEEGIPHTVVEGWQ